MILPIIFWTVEIYAFQHYDSGLAPQKCAAKPQPGQHQKTQRGF